jgi:hypothetical protein
MKRLFFVVFALTAWYVWAGGSGEEMQVRDPFFETEERGSPPAPASLARSAEPAAPGQFSGGIGTDARDEIALRRAWINRLNECDTYVAAYIQNTPPPAFLVYSTVLEKGAINWERETLALNFRIALYPDKNWPLPLQNRMNEAYAGLAATGRAQAWNIEWPRRAVSGGPSPIDAETRREYLVALELVNSQGQVIGTQSVSLGAGWKTGFAGPNAPRASNVGLTPETASRESKATAASIQTVKTVAFPNMGVCLPGREHDGVQLRKLDFPKPGALSMEPRQRRNTAAGIGGEFRAQCLGLP